MTGGHVRKNRQNVKNILAVFVTHIKAKNQ